MNSTLRNALVIGGVIVALLIVSSFLGGGWQGGGMMGSGMMGGGMWLFSSLIGITILGLLIWGAVLVVRGIASSGGGEPGRGADSALEILKKRYARGEINKEEFEEKKKDLS